MKNILVLGGDGFCGWASALHLADNQENNVTIVDNLSHRRIDEELGVHSLTPIASINERLKTWNELKGDQKSIDFENLDVSDINSGYDQLLDLLMHKKPEAIIHFAEQRAAPYSMKNSKTRRYTVMNNIGSTNNLLTAINEAGLESHVIHLGTMGVYGYGNSGSASIPEGYLKVKIETPEGLIEQEILHPANPGSVYHNTKVMDQYLLAFANKNDGIRVTDLHQGIVWGTQTKQTMLDEKLINRFDYDGDYGTVLNRFIVQAAINYPLTVHGTGGQKRAFIHIQDTVKCIQEALENPPEPGERPAIYNQISETHRVIDLAKLICKISGATYELVANPRKEAESNELNVDNDSLKDIAKIKLNEGLISEIDEIAKKYINRIDKSVIPATSNWT